jgi:phage gp36-like protein
MNFLQGERMKKFFLILLLVSALVAPAFAGAGLNKKGWLPGNSPDSLWGGEIMYCTRADLEGAYGADRVAGWSRLDPDTVDRAIARATAEIDGYLISGGYTVPLSGPPKNLQKYCVDIAAANLVISAGVLENDPGGKAVVEEAKNARHYLEKVAEGKFKIPGYAADDEVSKPPSGNVRVASLKRMDWRGY